MLNDYSTLRASTDETEIPPDIDELIKLVKATEQELLQAIADSLAQSDDEESNRV